jgi:YHS domain-containing protein
VSKPSVVHHFDPICGRPMESEGAGGSMEYKKKRYFFCSDGCRHAFERRAERNRVGELARMGSLFSPQRVRWGTA